MSRETKAPEQSKSNRRSQLRKLLLRKGGATIAQIEAAFGWQPHSARAAISGLRKAGDTIERSVCSKGTVYRIVGTGGS